MYFQKFLKTTLITPNIKIGKPLENAKIILENINKESGINIYPELSLTGYTLEDYFFQDELLNNTYKAIEYIIKNNNYNGILIIGSPLLINNELYNCALVFKNNKILGIIPKRSIPNSNEYYEKRWFKSGNNLNINKLKLLNQEVPFGNVLFNLKDNNLKFGIEVCEDTWSLTPPNIEYSKNGCNLVINISASNEVLHKNKIRENMILETSRRGTIYYLYVSQGVSESSTETIFSGTKIATVNGKLVHSSQNFDFETSKVDIDIDLGYINYERRISSTLKETKNTSNYQEIEFEFPVIKFNPLINKEVFNLNKEEIKMIENIIASSIKRRLNKVNTTKTILGLSGGIDSTHALIQLVNTYKKYNLNLKDIKCLLMPGLESSKSSLNDSLELINKLNISYEIIDIKEEAKLHLKTINHDKKDITYENTQARIRTLYLMNIANKEKSIVIGTGDLTEIALGFSTYNGDQMSMYQINSGLPKTAIQSIIKYYIDINLYDLKEPLTKVLNKPISPELNTNQETERIIGLYKINDFILYRYLFCGDNIERINYLLENNFNLSKEESNNYAQRFFKRFINNQFKRQASPDGPKIFEFTLSAKTSYRLPSDLEI